MKLTPILALTSALVLSAGLISHAQEAVTKSMQAKPRTMTRLFWQDSDTNTIRWSDLQRGTEWSLSASDIASFPKLDKQQCSLVQMEETEGVLLTGVQDHEDGAVNSGWIAINCGVEREAHGDHFHWKFAAQPNVLSTKLDATEGNPAHIYRYGSRFYIANDKKDGFTVVDPKMLIAGKAADRFFNGGGGHITMAAVDGRVCYSTWIDRDGENMGRVDVVPLIHGQRPGYSIRLPWGGIHGATANSGRVFFAPADGVCWIDADKDLSKNGTDVSVGHLSLGKDATDKPLRTGAFSNHLNWVLFVTGTGEAAKFCLIDAKSSEPVVVTLPLGLADGTSATTPTVAALTNGKHYAFLFQESRDAQHAEKLLVIQLDINGDGDLSDARLTNTIEVGASKIEGHSGHHDITITPSRRFALLTNPGDGSIWVLSLSDMEIQARLNVGGTPTHVVAIGG